MSDEEPIEQWPKIQKPPDRPSPGAVLGVMCIPPVVCGALQLIGYSLTRVNGNDADSFWIAGAVFGLIASLGVSGWLAAICRTTVGAFFAFSGYFICCFVIITAISFAGCAANMKGI